MPASYPSSIKTWTDKVDNVDDVFAGDVNGAYAEIISIETRLTIMHSIYTTSGSANTYTATVAGITAQAQLTGIPLHIKINADATNTSTLNVNSYGAVSIDSTNLKADKIYTVIYDGTSSFQLQGEGGGVIDEADVKLGVAYEDSEGSKTGTYDARLYQTGTLSSLTASTPTNITGIAFTPKYFMITGYYDDGAGNSGYSYMSAARGTSIAAGTAYTSLSSISIRNWGWLSDGITVMPGINYTDVKWVAWSD